MPAFWKRDVKIDTAGDYLAVTKSAQGANPNPPRNHNPRYDTDLEIEVFPDDRVGGGARIRYNSEPGLILTGIEMKETDPATGDPISVPPDLDVFVHPQGRFVRLTITKSSDSVDFKGAMDDEDWDYYVTGYYYKDQSNQPVDLKTQDPRIRNRAL